MSIISFTRNRRGIALFNMMFLLIFIGVLVGAGAKMYGSMVVRGKINDTKVELEREVQMITAWAVKNGRLPKAADYPGVFGGATPVDAWGKSIYYIYDDSLTATSSGGLCGRTTTSLSNNAFALVSGGEDFDILSTADGTAITGSKAATAFAPDQSDLYRIVTLEELKNKAGCYGTTGGRLRIINNELPRVCEGNPYSATIFADGGVPPYTWPAFTGLPAGLAQSGAGISGTPTTAGIYPVSISTTDNHAPSQNTVQRIFNLNVLSSSNAACPATPNGAVITFKDNFPVQVIGGGNKVAIVQDADAQSVTILTVGSGSGTGCQWYNNKMTLGSKEVMKAYVEYTLDNDTSSDSGDFGDGFTFTLLNDGSDIYTTCGANGKALGYDGIAGSHVVEFDSVQDSNGDPLTNNDIRNHVAVMETNASHAGNSCFQYPTQGSCQYDSTTKWFENGVKHNARIELDEQTLTMKVWIDCGECTPWDTINNRLGFPTPATAPNLVKQLTGMTKTFYFGFTTSTGAHAKMVQTIKLEHFNLGIYNK